MVDKSAPATDASSTAQAAPAVTTFVEVEVPFSDAEEDAAGPLTSLDVAQRRLRALSASPADAGSAVAGAADAPASATTEEAMRYLLQRLGLPRVLQAFVAEWAELKAAVQLPSQEKAQLTVSLARLRKHYSLYEPTIAELRRKYEAAVRERALLVLQRDRLAAAVIEQAQPLQEPGAAASEAPSELGSTDEACMLPPLPEGKLSCEARQDSSAAAAAVDLRGLALVGAFAAHAVPASCLALHPCLAMVVTGSDDCTWRMFHLPTGEAVMSGEGHTGWLAAVAFHPQAELLASGAGDAAVKLWSFRRRRCVATLYGHGAGVRGVAFHAAGEFLASASLDAAARIWDAAGGACRQTLRGHADAVHDVAWQPGGGGVLMTASADRTAALWDARSGQRCLSLRGHSAALASAAFGPQGTQAATADAEGCVKVWELRTGAERVSISAAPAAAGRACFDASGQVLVVASSGGQLLCCTAANGTALAVLPGHEGGARAALCCAQGLVSTGADGFVRLWA
ncbi:hypothetical protein WJX81_002170 [Elliptochloris bilobata]|uniref:Uncharacterized protein n=1 Tax=Elliptochloris bilobata TaxID=381761 RepID=A0AAW1SIX3_9CHLO